MKIGLVSPFPPPHGGMTVLGGTLERCLRSLGHEVVPIKTNAASGVWRNAGSLLCKASEFLVFIGELRKVVHADVILVVSSSGNYFGFKALPALAVGKMLRKPVILDFVGGGLLERLERGDTRLVRPIQWFDGVIVPTSVFERAFRNAGVQCECIPHIVDIDRFSPAKGESHPLVLFAAKNLEDYSGVDMIIKAFGEVKKRFSEARVLIAGDGPQRDALERLVRDMNLSGVEFLGNVPYTAIPGHLSRASIFVHGTKFESFGIVLVEAMASGTPIVSTDSGGIPDIIEDGVNGFLVKHGDWKGMADRVCQITQDQALYDRLVSGGLEKSRQYSCAMVSEKLLRLMERVVVSRDDGRQAPVTRD